MTPVFVITLQDIIGIAIVAIIVLCFGTYTLIEFVKQSRCKHDAGVNETQACDAICRKCGKNLGFIGTWREKQKNEKHI